MSQSRLTGRTEGNMQRFAALFPIGSTLILPVQSVAVQPWIEDSKRVHSRRE
jgi:hypothetical protein